MGPRCVQQISASSGESIVKKKFSVKLNHLFDHTKRFLGAYKNKSQWPALYPQVNKLAQLYRQLYTHNPYALQAQLTLYYSHVDYATNIVIKQTIITTALCASQHFDDELSALYISASLCDHLCVGEQLNTLASQKKFTENDKKRWQLRHKYAAKLMLNGGSTAKPIAYILAKLSKYQHALVSTPKIMLYDGGITLVAMANVLAKNITYSSSHKHISLYTALGDLYIRSPNQYAQQLLMSFIAHLGPNIPGSEVNYLDQTMIYLSTDQHGRHVLISLQNERNYAWFRVRAKLNDNSIQRVCSDKRLVFSVWDSEHIEKKEPKNATPSDLLISLISNIKVQQEYSYKGLNQILAAHPYIVLRLCDAVKPYNKEHQSAKDLKHSLSMVGYNNAPAIIQRVVFEELVNTVSHPLKAFIVNRLDALVKIMALVVSKNKQLQFEHIVLPLYAYTYCLLTHYSTSLSRKIRIDELPNKEMSIAFYSFFGIETVKNDELSLSITHLLSDNPWTLTLLEAERVQKKDMSSNHKLWVAIKALAQYIFKPEHTQSPWQKQVIKEQLALNGWNDQSVFYTTLRELNIADSI